MSGQTCPRAELHTPCPEGYGAWMSWARAMTASRHSQGRCPGCGLYKIWSGLQPVELVAVHERACANALARTATAGTEGDEDG